MIISVLRLLALLFWVAIMYFPTLITGWLVPQRRPYWAQRFFRGCCRICHIDLHIHGSPSAEPALIVSNHLSYLDILVLGAAAPAIFTPKSDIARWPIIGHLTRFSGAVFIERKARGVKEQLHQIQAALASGLSVILFGEGTSSDGLRILPFKSTLFALGEQTGPGKGESLRVQPVALSYSRLGSLPIRRADKAEIAWVGDDDLVSHAMRRFSGQQVRADVLFQPVIMAAEYKDRKELADAVRGQVLDGLRRLREKEKRVDAGRRGRLPRRRQEPEAVGSQSSIS